MSNQTARLGLPFIMPGQAQKEVFHNEALSKIDMALQSAVEGTRGAPPISPQPGQSWIVAAGAAGEWGGRENHLASWTEGGWRYVAPTAGFSVWDLSGDHPLRWTGSNWSAGDLRGVKLILGGKKVVSERQPHVPSPSGGTIIDAEARESIDKLIATLMSHGLID